jgi:hypothetical protein
MNRRRLSAGLLLAAALAACGPKVETLSTRFDPNEGAVVNREGSGSVSGQAFLKTVGGEVRYAAGNTVEIFVATAYARERIGKLYGASKCNMGGVTFKETDPRYLAMKRETKADGEGRFHFDHMAAGDYFVVTTVAWQVPNSGGYLTQTGCNIYERLTVQEGRNTEIILSGS